MDYGDIRLGDTIDIKFTTRQFSTGAPFTLAGTPAVSAYVGNGTTEITAGITLSVDFDGRTGLNNVRVVASGGNGFATATNVQLVITAGTVDSVSVVGEVVGSFSIEARSAVMPTTAARTLDVDADGAAEANVTKLGGVVQSLTDLKDFADDGYDPATNKVQGVVLVDTLTTYTGNTPQTGDSFARLGAPAGASVSADVAAIKAVVDAILTDTGTTLDAKIDAIKAITDLLTAAQAEPTGVPAANDTPLVKLARLHQALRNRVDVDANTGKKSFFDDADAALWEKDFTDAGGVYSESEGNAP